MCISRSSLVDWLVGFDLLFHFLRAHQWLKAQITGLANTSLHNTLFVCEEMGQTDLVTIKVKVQTDCAAIC